MENFNVSAGKQDISPDDDGGSVATRSRSFPKRQASPSRWQRSGTGMHGKKRRKSGGHITSLEEVLRVTREAEGIGTIVKCECRAKSGIT